MNQALRTLAVAGPVAALAALFMAMGVFNLGQVITWIGFFAALVSALAFLATMGGREGFESAARNAFRIQWVALLAASLLLWKIIFSHEFQYQYVASYSSTQMPWHYLYAAFWGGQEGTFLLWALFTATLGLLLMRVKHPLIPSAMFFLNLPLVMLGLVTVMRGPFLLIPGGLVPPEGNGLNPLLQDPWMTIHPPILFVGFSSLAVPFAIAMAALVKRQYDGWIKPALPWVVFSTAILATGFIMGGVWAYKVLGWGGYWGWDPVENGSFIPWLANTALLHGLLVQRVTGSLRRTNFFLAVTSYVLVLYASFLTRSGVLSDFSVHSFVNLGLNGFLLSFLFLIMILGYGLLVYRMRDIPNPKEVLGNFSRESMMWLGQLVFMLMCALITVGMSAPLITQLFGPASNVQTSYYTLVNAPLGVAMGLLLGIAPLMRWRKQDPKPLLRAVTPALVMAVVVTMLALAGGIREIMSALLVFSAAWALTSNAVVTMRGFKAGWKHGAAYLGHMGVGVLLIGVVASSGYGTSVQVQLPEGEERIALGYVMKYEGMAPDREGRDQAQIMVAAAEREFNAEPYLYWSEFNKGYMKKPHIERFLTHDIYISPLERIGGDEEERAEWFSKGETRVLDGIEYTFVGFTVEGMDGSGPARVAARMRAVIDGEEVNVRPVVEMTGGQVPNRIPDYLPGGGSVTIVSVDATSGRVGLELPGMAQPASGSILAVEVSTKPLINLVWLGAIIMLGSGFLSMWRRILDMRRESAKA